MGSVRFPLLLRVLEWNEFSTREWLKEGGYTWDNGEKEGATGAGMQELRWRGNPGRHDTPLEIKCDDEERYYGNAIYTK